MTTTTYQPPRKNRLGLVVVIGLVTLAIVGLLALAVVGIHSSLPPQAAPAPPTTTQQAAPADDVSTYLQSLHDEGVTALNGDDDVLVTAGHVVCANLRNGSTHLQEVNSIVEANPKMTRKGASAVVVFANAFFCTGVDPEDTTVPPLNEQ